MTDLTEVRTRLMIAAIRKGGFNWAAQPVVVEEVCKLADALCSEKTAEVRASLEGRA